MPPEQRRIGMVFQDYALFPHLTVGRNVAFGMHHLPRPEPRASACAEVLALVGLAGSEARFPHELSGGQQQRVALARALAPRPRLMLLDEPFSNLDVDLRERLAHEVRGILKAAGATALFVTHDQLEAFAIGDRDRRDAGQAHLHQWDEAYALYHRPATRFVASFIGHGVFAPGHAGAARAAPVVVRTPLGELAESDRMPAAVEPTRAGCAMCCCAPTTWCTTTPPRCRRSVLRKAFRGAEFLYTLRLESGQTLMAHVPSHHDHAAGRMDRHPPPGGPRGDLRARLDNWHSLSLSLHHSFNSIFFFTNL